MFWFAMRVIWSGISIVLYEAIGKTGKTYGGYLTDYTFNGFIAGRRGTAQDDDISTLNRIEHVGLAVHVDMMGKTQVCQSSIHPVRLSLCTILLWRVHHRQKFC